MAETADPTAGLQVYLVGGAVRDHLLGLPVTERDWVVVGTTPETLLARGFRPVGKEFPVFLHPQTREEYALARTERKTAPGYTGFEFHAATDVTLEQDLQRRDLTINAMAEAPDGTLIDPFHGAEDLREGLLRHVSPAFAEDPVRVLRVARLAARYARWGFRVAHGTNALMRRMVATGEVDALVPERVWKELQRALGEDRPAQFFRVLFGCGALARLFPELDGRPGTPQQHGKGDGGALAVLEAAAGLTTDPAVRFAALVHDLGEGEDPAEQARNLALIQSLCQRLRIPNDYRDLALRVARHHRDCDAAPELPAEAVIDLLEALDAWRRPQRFEQLLLACEAVARGAPGVMAGAYPQAAYLRAARAAATAVSTEGLRARGLKGPALGAELRRQRVAAVAALPRPALD